MITKIKFVFKMLVMLASMIVSVTLLAGAQAQAALQQGNFQQPIDHFGQINGTFNQRFWIDSEFAVGPNAPVILRLCGEDAGDYFVQTDSSRYFAQQLHAYVIYLEHRFYGPSQPFADQSNEHLKFLSLDNVIEDAAYFQKATAQHYALTGKWIVLGGSYSGTLAAIYRLRHPELVAGALAASAPMFTKNFATDSSDVNDASIADTTLQNPPDADRAWAYQSCSTFGFWIYQGFSPTIYQPSAQLCSRDFGLTQRLNYDAYNQAFYAPFVTGSQASASNILFSSGSNDPWNQLSVNAQNNHNSAVSVILIQGAGHHFDLNLPTSQDSKNVLAARAQFLQLASRWLGLR